MGLITSGGVTQPSKGSMGEAGFDPRFVVLEADSLPLGYQGGQELFLFVGYLASQQLACVSQGQMCT